MGHTGARSASAPMLTPSQESTLLRIYDYAGLPLGQLPGGDLEALCRLGLVSSGTDSAYELALTANGTNVARSLDNDTDRERIGRGVHAASSSFDAHARRCNRVRDDFDGAPEEIRQEVERLLSGAK